MSLVADLSEFALSDLFQFVGDREGTIEILESGEAIHLQLEINHGRATRYRRDGLDLKDPQAVVASLGQAASHARGMASFHPKSSHKNSFDIPLSTLAMRVVIEVDEITQSGRLACIAA